MPFASIVSEQSLDSLFSSLFGSSIPYFSLVSPLFILSDSLFSTLSSLYQLHCTWGLFLYTREDRGILAWSVRYKFLVYRGVRYRFCPSVWTSTLVGSCLSSIRAMVGEDTTGVCGVCILEVTYCTSVCNRYLCDPLPRSSPNRQTYRTNLPKKKSLVLFPSFRVQTLYKPILLYPLSRNSP